MIFFYKESKFNKTNMAVGEEGVGFARKSDFFEGVKIREDWLV